MPYSSLAQTWGRARCGRRTTGLSSPTTVRGSSDHVALGGGGGGNHAPRGPDPQAPQNPNARAAAGRGAKRRHHRHPERTALAQSSITVEGRGALPRCRSCAEAAKPGRERARSALSRALALWGCVGALTFPPAVASGGGLCTTVGKAADAPSRCHFGGALAYLILGQYSGRR